MTTPFDLESIASPALDGIVRAISERPGQTEARRAARCQENFGLIMALGPRDAMEMMLCGQTVMFNELVADSAREVLRGMIDTVKSRSISNLINMARLVQGNLDRLEKRGVVPAREAAEAEADEACADSDAAPLAREGFSPASAVPPDVPRAGLSPASAVPLDVARAGHRAAVAADVARAGHAPPGEPAVSAARMLLAAYAASADIGTPGRPGDEPDDADATDAEDDGFERSGSDEGETFDEADESDADNGLESDKTDDAASVHESTDRASAENPALVAHGSAAEGAPDQGGSWLDEPFDQWVVETPADAAKRVTEMMLEVASTMMRATRDKSCGDPALPRRPDGYARHPELENAGD